MNRLPLAAALAALAAPALAQSHSPTCDNARAKVRAAIAAMDEQSDWLKWYMGTWPKSPHQPDKPIYSTAVMLPHDLKFLAAQKDRVQGLQVMLDNQCLVSSDESRAKDTISQDQDSIKHVEAAVTHDEQSKKDLEVDFAKVDPCVVLGADVETFKLVVEANAAALLQHGDIPADRRKELALDTVREVDEMLPKIRAKGQTCGMTAREVETTVGELTETRKLYSWALE
jgi:hypothetical protein